MSKFREYYEVCMEVKDVCLHEIIPKLGVILMIYIPSSILFAQYNFFVETICSMGFAFGGFTYISGNLTEFKNAYRKKKDLEKELLEEER